VIFLKNTSENLKLTSPQIQKDIVGDVGINLILTIDMLSIIKIKSIISL
jgi:hypothetical protein